MIHLSTVLLAPQAGFKLPEYIFGESECKERYMAECFHGGDQGKV